MLILMGSDKINPDLQVTATNIHINILLEANDYQLKEWKHG